MKTRLHSPSKPKQAKQAKRLSVRQKPQVPSPVYTRFDVYWWVASDGPDLCRYRTRNAKDIQQFSASHFRIIAHPVDPDHNELELILREKDGAWAVKSDSFADLAEDYPIAFATTDEGAVWTVAHDDEVMIIKATS